MKVCDQFPVGINGFGVERLTKAANSGERLTGFLDVGIGLNLRLQLQAGGFLGLLKRVLRDLSSSSGFSFAGLGGFKFGPKRDKLFGGLGKLRAFLDQLTENFQLTEVTDDWIVEIPAKWHLVRVARALVVEKADIHGDLRPVDLLHYEPVAAKTNASVDVHAAHGLADLFG